jgi:hypothetical protein
VGKYALEIKTDLDLVYKELSGECQCLLKVELMSMMIPALGVKFRYLLKYISTVKVIVDEDARYNVEEISDISALSASY